MFPGLLIFKAQIDARGNHELICDEDDMRIQAHVDYHLCQCLLQDSAPFRWVYPDSLIWRALEVFQDPTTPFMKWHHGTLTPWVRQLQRDADSVCIHASIRNMRGGRTVLDRARSNLGIEVASTLISLDWSCRRWSGYWMQKKQVQMPSRFCQHTLPHHHLCLMSSFLCCACQRR